MQLGQHYLAGVLVPQACAALDVCDDKSNALADLGRQVQHARRSLRSQELPVGERGEAGRGQKTQRSRHEAPAYGPASASINK